MRDRRDDRRAAATAIDEVLGDVIRTDPVAPVMLEASGTVVPQKPPRRRPAASVVRYSVRGATFRGGPEEFHLMRDGTAPPDPLHLVGHRRTVSSPVPRASS